MSAHFIPCRFKYPHRMAVAEKTKAKTVAAMERIFQAARELVDAERNLRAEAEGSASASSKRQTRAVSAKEIADVKKE